MRTPHNFPAWIAKEMDKIRALNMHLELHIVGGLDVWPANWEGCLKYGDSFWFDKRLFSSFWKGRSLLNPPVFTVGKAGISPIKLLKKMFVVRLTTEDMTPQDCVIYNEDIHCDWQASGFLDAYFMKCIKFYIDFNREDLQLATQLAQRIAGTYRGHFNRYAIRSFGDGGGCKRKCFVIAFAPHSKIQEDETLGRFCGDLMAEYNLAAAVGFENLFQNGPGTYQIRYDTNLVMSEITLLMKCTQIVIVAKNRAIIELNQTTTSKELEDWFKEFNDTTGKTINCRFRMILGSNTSVVWKETAQRIPTSEPPALGTCPHPAHMMYTCA
jgi:hypothetical protein